MSGRLLVELACDSCDARVQTLQRTIYDARIEAGSAAGWRNGAHLPKGSQIAIQWDACADCDTDRALEHALEAALVRRDEIRARKRATGHR